MIFIKRQKFAISDAVTNAIERILATLISAELCKITLDRKSPQTSIGLMPGFSSAIQAIEIQSENENLNNSF